MSALTWYAVHPPRNLDIEAVTAFLRPLASRPRAGLTARMPLVVFEMAGSADGVQWRIGFEQPTGGDLPALLAAQVSHLELVPIKKHERPTLLLAADLRLSSLASPLRTDMASAVSTGLASALAAMRVSQTGVIQWVVGPTRPRTSAPVQVDWETALGLKPQRSTDAAAARLWKQKAVEPIFACRGRIGAAARTPSEAYAIVRRLASAVQLTSSAHASLRLGKSTRRTAAKTDEAAAPLTWSCLLGAAELANVLGWPVQDEPGDGLPLIGGHINPAPDELLVAEDDAERSGQRLLGESLHPSQRGELVSMPAKTCLHHVHVIGPTGSGKSTLLANMVLGDLAAGHGVLVAEPKGDLINDLLARVPAERRDDVVVIEPAGERSVGVNVLAGPREEAERRADQIVSLLAELHGANFGPRSTDVALHALITASRMVDGTLPDVVPLLTQPAFRRRVLTDVADPLVLGPWWAWYDGITEAERGQIIAPIMNKLRAFLSRDALRRMLGQASPAFELDELFTKRRIVLINLNRSLLGPETSALLGALLLSQVFAAIQRRAAVPADDRHPVMLVIDEWQDYLRLPGIDFGDALAQFRGLGVSLTLAHQHLDQLSKAQQAAVLANARSRVIFRPATDDARPLAAALGGSLDGSDLMRLRAYEACCQLLVNGQSSRPFSVRTYPLPPWTGNVDRLRQLSAERYGVPGTEVDADLLARWQAVPHTRTAPIGTRRRRSA